MWSFSRDAVAAAGIIGCFVLVAAIQGGGGFSGEATDDSLYETTGSIGGINRAILPLERTAARAHPSRADAVSGRHAHRRASARSGGQGPQGATAAGSASEPDARNSAPARPQVLEAERSDIARRPDEPRGGGDDPALPPPPVALLALERPRGSHAPLQAGHPVIPARQLEARPCQIQRSVLTGSSACADDDDREDDN